jgi:hypothetical protein
MVTIRKSQSGNIVLLCEDLPGGLARRRLEEAWPDRALVFYPLSRTALEYVDGDMVCCGRLEGARWPMVRQALGLPNNFHAPDADGSFVIQTIHSGERRVLLCLGVGISGLLVAIEELVRSADFSADGLVYPDEARVERPVFPYRLFWTWDHSTNWALGQEGQVDWGVLNEYVKPAEAYTDDYARLIDWVSRNRINGVVIWGFLRDRHGGIGAAQQLCDYATARGVRILPGVGTSFYGGFYYQGDHLFNAATWLRRHPEYAALDRRGRATDRLCPSEPANQEWLREGTHWLFETFDIGGVNLESGDFMVCFCARCQALRAGFGEADPDFFKEMALSLAPVAEEILRIRPDAWITYGTYTGFNPGPLPRDLGDPNPEVVLNLANMGSADPWLVRALPPESIGQWSLTAMVHQEPVAMLDFLDDGSPEGMWAAPSWPAGLQPPSQHSIGLLHQGSQWYSRGRGHTRYSVEIASIKEACLHGVQVGLEGLAITGEASPAYTACELNYLALAHFSYHPADSLRAFARRALAPRVGGVEAAEEFVTYLAKREAGQMTLTDEARLAARVNDVMQETAAGGDWQAYRRWRWLSSYCTAQVCDATGALLTSL